MGSQTVDYPGLQGHFLGALALPLAYHFSFPQDPYSVLLSRSDCSGLGCVTSTGQSLWSVVLVGLPWVVCSVLSFTQTIWAKSGEMIPGPIKVLLPEEIAAPSHPCPRPQPSKAAILY